MNIALLLTIFTAALVASLFGLGGGVLYTPFQLWLGIPLKQAAATSLFLVLVTSLSSTITFRHSHRVDWSLALILEIPTTLGAFVGGFISNWFPAKVLGGLLVALLFLAAGLMIRPPEKPFSSCVRTDYKGRSLWLWRREWEGESLWLDLRRVFAIMFVAGMLISMVGISGGVLKIPLMVLLMQVPMSVAVGSSAFMVGLTALAGLLGHATAGHVAWHTVFVLAVPVFLGAQLGSRASIRLGTHRLKHYYGWFLTLVAVITLLRILNLR